MMKSPFPEEREVMMQRHRFGWWSLGLLMALLLVACGRAPQATPRAAPGTLPRAQATLTPLTPIDPTPTVLPSATPSPRPTATPTPTWTPWPTPTPTPTYEPIRFAVIGDFGYAGPAAEAVARLVRSWDPDFIVTTGDNNYPNGSAFTFEANVMAYYGDYIESQRFFPSMGNHDWGYYTVNTLPYVKFFDYLPGNKRYYDFVRGPVHFFMLDSDPREPDGITPESVQGQWLRERMQNSTLPWQVVVFHHAPYSSGTHRDTKYMQWPFSAWGADLVLTGHDHTYERVHRQGIVFIVNGVGGHPSLYRFTWVTPGSQIRYNKTHGAVLIEATAERIQGWFYNIHGELIDEFVITREP